MRSLSMRKNLSLRFILDSTQSIEIDSSVGKNQIVSILIHCYDIGGRPEDATSIDTESQNHHAS